MKELTIKTIQNHIVQLPNRPPAMIASDVAQIYEVPTKHVNQAVKRNPQRFPEDFCFKLTPEEFENLRSQNETLTTGHHGGVRYLPWMFTRFGANQLSTVLRSPVADLRSVQIIRAFTMLEESYQQQQPVNEPQPTTYELPPSSAEVPAHCMVIPMQEYIEMQRNEITYLKNMLTPKPRKKSRPLTDADRAEIIELKKQGHSQAEIARMTGRSSATVSFLCNASREV